MIKSTVDDLLDGRLDAQLEAALADFVKDKIEDLPQYRLYVVRDGNTVFYVGQSRGVTARLMAHMGLDRLDVRGRACCPSYLGQLIESNLPASLSWQIDLYTVKDCAALVEKHFPMFINWDIDDAERALIVELRPCLNVVHNDDPSVLPERYMHVDQEPEEAKRKAAQKLHVPYYRQTLRE